MWSTTWTWLSSAYVPRGGEAYLHSRQSGRCSRCFGTVESEVVWRQEGQIVQSQFNLDDFFRAPWKGARSLRVRIRAPWKGARS